MLTFFDQQKLNHYYGDITRMMFIFSALIMLFGLPAINGYLNIPSALSIGAILILAITAGLTSPRYLWSAILNTVVAAIGFVVFEAATLQTFSERSTHGELFIANLALGTLFLIATYFGIKTIRGFYIKTA